MYFRDIIGQEAAKRLLLETAQRGIVPHAQLFVGRDGSGALGLAYAYARYLNCQEPSATDACGHCPSCRRYDGYAEQELLYLFPIVNEAGRNYCSDYLEPWRQYLARGPYGRYEEWLEQLGATGKRASIFAREGDELQQHLSYRVGGKGYRVLIVWCPERMQEALGNKLLKFVEEPADRTVILMVTMQEELVLGTLRSRMQRLQLQPLSEGELIGALMALPSVPAGSDALLAAHLADGSWRRARELFLGEDTSDRELFGYLQRILRATVNAQPLEMRVLGDELAQLSRDEQTQLIEYLARMFREFYLYNLQQPELNYLTSREQGIAQYLRRVVTGQNVRVVQEELDLAQRHLAQNVNARMVFFDLLLRLTSALAASYRQHGIR